MTNIEIGWDNEDKTVMRCTYQGQWTWQEFYVATEQSHQMMDTVDHPVDILVDMRASAQIPQGAVTQFRRIANTWHRNTGTIVAVTEARVAQMLYDIFATIFRHVASRYHVVRTMDEAYVAIEDARYQRSTQ